MPDMLSVSRDLPIPRWKAWEWLTESYLTAKWYGPYRMMGNTLLITMIHEDGKPEVEGALLDYADGRMLRLRAGTVKEGFVFRVQLDDAPGGTRVTVSQKRANDESDQRYEAGWHFYLDALANAVAGKPAPVFADYEPKTDKKG